MQNVLFDNVVINNPGKGPFDHQYNCENVVRFSLSWYMRAMGFAWLEFGDQLRSVGLTALDLVCIDVVDCERGGMQASGVATGTTSPVPPCFKDETLHAAKTAEKV